MRDLVLQICMHRQLLLPQYRPGLLDIPAVPGERFPGSFNGSQFSYASASPDLADPLEYISKVISSLVQHISRVDRKCARIEDMLTRVSASLSARDNRDERDEGLGQVEHVRIGVPLEARLGDFANRGGSLHGRGRGGRGRRSGTGW